MNSKMTVTKNNQRNAFAIILIQRNGKKEKHIVIFFLYFHPVNGDKKCTHKLNTKRIFDSRTDQHIFFHFFFTSVSALCMNTLQRERHLHCVE